MATLGDLLAAARNASGRFHKWLLESDPGLSAQVDEAAKQTAISPTGYVRAAVADFSRFASEEDWATLTSSLRDSDDPGTVCLLAMLHWRLTSDGCGAHSHRQHQPQHEHGGASQ